MRWWELLKVAVDGARRTPLRVALTATGVAIATGALLSMVAFAEGLKRQAERPFEDLDLFNRIEVWVDDETAQDEGEDAKPAEVDEAAPSAEQNPKPTILDDAAVERLRAIPGVALAYPEMTKAGLELSIGDEKASVFATALPAESADMPYVKTMVRAGRFFGADAKDEALVGREAAKELGFEDATWIVGREIEATAMGLVPVAPMGFRYEKQTVSLKVVGVWEGSGFAAGPMSRILIVPFEVMRTLPGISVNAAMDQMRRGGFSGGPVHRSIVVRAAHASDVPEIEKEIKALGYKTRTVVTQFESMRTFFVVLDVLLGAVGTVALVVAGLGIVNTLLMAVLERYREIGAFKAIGASDGDVRLMFLAEAGIVGVLGGIGGLALGRLVSWVIGFGVQAYARSKEVTQDVAVFAFPWWLVAGALVFAVAASVASGVYPASRAARVDPIRALRGE